MSVSDEEAHHRTARGDKHDVYKGGLKPSMFCIIWCCGELVLAEPISHGLS